MPANRVRPKAGPVRKLVPDIHAFNLDNLSKAWMPGTSPAMTLRDGD
jgi:hypothetical protein